MPDAGPTPTAATVRPKRVLLDRIVTWTTIVLIAACALAVWKRDQLRAWWWARELVQATGPDRQAMLVALLSAMHEDSVPAARWLLDSSSPRIRALGATILAQGRGEAARRALLAALNDPDADVRDEAAHALAFGHGDAALPLLLQSIPALPTPAALAACVAIGRIDTDSAIEPLMALMKEHANPAVRAQAAELLGLRSGEAEAGALREAQNDPGEFSELLYCERRMEGAAGFAAEREGLPHSAVRPAMKRTVGQIAALALDRVLTAASRPATAASHPFKRADASRD